MPYKDLPHCIMSMQYTGGVQYTMSAVGEGIMSTLGVFSIPGDIMSTPGDIMIN